MSSLIIYYSLEQPSPGKEVDKPNVGQGWKLSLINLNQNKGFC